MYYYTRVRRRRCVKENVVVDKYTSEIITTTERLLQGATRKREKGGGREREREREKDLYLVREREIGVNCDIIMKIGDV